VLTSYVTLPGTTSIEIITTVIPITYTATERITDVITTPVTVEKTLPQVTVEKTLPPVTEVETFRTTIPITELTISTFKTTELSIYTTLSVMTSYITSYITTYITGRSLITHDMHRISWSSTEPGTTYTSISTVLVPVPYTITAIQTETTVYTTPITIHDTELVTLPPITVTDVSISTFQTTELSISTFLTTFISIITSYITTVITGEFVRVGFPLQHCRGFKLASMRKMSSAKLLLAATVGQRQVKPNPLPLSWTRMAFVDNFSFPTIKALRKI
jgi:hypothetical protein